MLIRKIILQFKIPGTIRCKQIPGKHRTVRQCPISVQGSSVHQRQRVVINTHFQRIARFHMGQRENMHIHRIPRHTTEIRFAIHQFDVTFEIGIECRVKPVLSLSVPV